MACRRQPPLPAGAVRPSQDAGQWLPVERVAEFEILVQHRVTLVPAQLLEARGVHAPVHARGNRAEIKAVAADHGRVVVGGRGAS